MRGPVLLTIGESVMVNLDHVCLDNQSHYSLDVTEFQSAFTDTIGMNGKCRKLNPTSPKKAVTRAVTITALPLHRGNEMRPRC